MFSHRRGFSQPLLGDAPRTPEVLQVILGPLLGRRSHLGSLQSIPRMDLRRLCSQLLHYSPVNDPSPPSEHILDLKILTQGERFGPGVGEFQVVLSIVWPISSSLLVLLS